MKYRLIFLLIFPASGVFAQFPSFLNGTWKRTDKNSYEQWSETENGQLKGVSFKMKDGLPEILEYSDLLTEGNEIFLVATVPAQNQGKSIRFRLKQDGQRYVFENAKHDFPQQIVYEYLSEDNLKISLSGAGGGGVSYQLARVSPSRATASADNPLYDEVLAKRLGADDYGMKSYWLVILKTGANTTTDKAFISESFRGHMENIGKMVEDGKLVVAGPMGKNDKTYRGIFILSDPGTEEDVKEQLLSDPAVKAGLLEAEIYKWYGSAALSEYLPASDKVWKSKP